ncbi:MAG: hypothetical protein KatS3mg131_3591 [Candidatus Tectimicrobiota bacterium]|nr:MAG: hypothetical protein KatS3mg131_3591 [Candidatus Tectomicrobia bacterium]
MTSAPSVSKHQLERLCYRCRRANPRGSLCLLLLRESHSCARRAFLQRHAPQLLRPPLLPAPPRDPNPVLPLPPPPPAAAPPAGILELRARYGNPLSRWHGLFAHLRRSTPDP